MRYYHLFALISILNVQQMYIQCTCDLVYSVHVLHLSIHVIFFVTSLLNLLRVHAVNFMLKETLLWRWFLRSLWNISFSVCCSTNIEIIWPALFSVMDGEDLSRYDDVGKKQRDDRDDTEALDQLEWELASHEGRVTGKRTAKKFKKNYW